jgi:hypothetical protein
MQDAHGGPLGEVGGAKAGSPDGEEIPLPGLMNTNSAGMELVGGSEEGVKREGLLAEPEDEEPDDGDETEADDDGGEPLLIEAGGGLAEAINARRGGEGVEGVVQKVAHHLHLLEPFASGGQER